MRKCTQREIKNLIKCGMAHDLTRAAAEKVER